MDLDMFLEMDYEDKNGNLDLPDNWSDEGWNAEELDMTDYQNLLDEDDDSDI